MWFIIVLYLECPYIANITNILPSFCTSLPQTKVNMAAGHMIKRSLAG